MKLLIVDDQRSVHLYIQEVIDLPSLKVSKVQHAESSEMQALELLRRCHLDLMIMDIQIIDMNGVALAEVLRQEKIVYSETVVLTIYNEFLYAERYIDFGVRRYVQTHRYRGAHPHFMRNLSGCIPASLGKLSSGLSVAVFASERYVHAAGSSYRSGAVRSNLYKRA